VCRLLLVLAIFASTAVQAQSPTYQRGDTVRVRDVAKPAVLKIVGVPNDRIRSDDAGVYINDVAVSGFSPEFLARARWRNEVIPEGHYFVMGEQRLNQDVSEHIGIHPGADLEIVR
jgi:hypothetical protein